jgi:glycosyltransferase involved in cell wall biosynthesis
VARRARAVITVSEAMRGEISEILQVPPEKIFVTYPAPAEGFGPPAGWRTQPPEADAAARPGPAARDARTGAAGSKRSVESGLPPTPPYILFVGNVEPRKNLVRLLLAFDLLKSASGLPHELLVAGGSGWKRGPILAAWSAMRHRDAVRFLRYVPAEDLPALYARASLFVFPSLYEGFGIPPLEAMRCGTPVVVSDIPVHREVHGEAALFVDPLDPQAIAGGMRRVLEDADCARALRERGADHARLYTWERTASATLEVYRRVLSGD